MKPGLRPGLCAHIVNVVAGEAGSLETVKPLEESLQGSGCLFYIGEVHRPPNADCAEQHLAYLFLCRKPHPQPLTPLKFLVLKDL